MSWLDKFFGTTIVQQPGVLVETYVVDGASGFVSVGDCICITAIGTATRAVSAALALSGAVLGIATTAGGAGTPIVIREDGVLPPSVTGVSSFGPVRCNTTTGRLEVVSAFLSTDYPVGFSNAQGYVTMVRQLNVPAVPFTYASLGGLIADFNGNVGATASQWTDQTPNGNNLVQATGANQPSIITAGLNGLKTVRFNGTTSFMRCASFNLNANQMTMYTVMKLVNASALSVLCAYNLNTVYTSCSNLGYPQLTRGANQTAYAHVTIGEGFTIRSDHAHNDGTNQLYYAGTSQGTFTDSTTIPSTGTFDVGALNNGAGYFGQFDIARILVYNTHHTTAQEAQVEAQLHLDYAI